MCKCDECVVVATAAVAVFADVDAVGGDDDGNDAGADGGDEGCLLPESVRGTSTSVQRAVRQLGRRRERAVAGSGLVRRVLHLPLLLGAPADERRAHRRDRRPAAARRRHRPRSAATQEAVR